eukprot:scaffold57081_cov32-Tisochrysis_lutea.AAC.1
MEKRLSEFSGEQGRVLPYIGFEVLAARAALGPCAPWLFWGHARCARPRSRSSNFASNSNALALRQNLLRLKGGLTSHARLTRSSLLLASPFPTHVRFAK